MFSLMREREQEKHQSVAFGTHSDCGTKPRKPRYMSLMKLNLQPFDDGTIVPTNETIWPGLKYH